MGIVYWDVGYVLGLGPAVEQLIEIATVDVSLWVDLDLTKHSRHCGEDDSAEYKTSRY